MVETAMLAALAGLAYTLFTTVGLDKYVGYFLPVAPIVAALRNGSAACLRTVGATFVLLLVLQGPLRASVYFFLHGSMACVMGWAISRRVRWRVAVPAAALARVFGTLGYLAMTSWVMNENLLRLLVSNVCTLLDQIAASMGTTGVPSPSTVYGLIGVLLMVNGLAYSLLLHALYAVLLKGMGYTDIFVPKFFRKYGI
ncbi:unnamed protein product [Pedinophyceae sp. YPF-701]|nr:unnamed protein product [Pedinophyceae sp. YPF-701]